MAKIGFLLLCGGKSTRMESPKALLEVNGRTLLHAVAAAGADFDERILSVNDPVIPTPDGFVRCADRYFDCGPMAGIHAALSMTRCDALVTAPCDAPYYSASLAGMLREQYDWQLDALVLVDHAGRPQPLYSVYNKSCLPVLEEHLKAGKHKLMWMLEDMKLRKIELPDYLPQRVFYNLNTIEEFRSFKRQIECEALPH